MSYDCRLCQKFNFNYYCIRQPDYITSGITKEDTDVTHADDAENYRVSITGDFTVTSDTSDGVTQSGSVYTITKAGEYTVAGLYQKDSLSLTQVMRTRLLSY